MLLQACGTNSESKIKTREMSQNAIQTIAKEKKRKRGKKPRTEESPSILQDLLNLDKQPPITGPARDRMQEIDASVPKLQAIQAYTSPRNELAAEVARAIFHFESARVSLSAGCESDAEQRQGSNNNAVLTSQNSAPPPHSVNPKSPNSSGTVPSPGSRSSRAPSPLHTPGTAAASRHAAPP